MSYIDKINSELKPWVDENLDMTVLDLFAGCGGLSLGFESQGFKTVGYEMLSDASETYRHNLIGDCITEKLTVDTPFPSAEIVIGGPPCQPFSVGGKQLGLNDPLLSNVNQRSFFLKMLEAYFIRINGIYKRSLNVLSHSVIR